jgi:hypothetical protein
MLVAALSTVTLAFASQRIVAEDAAYRAPAGPQCVPAQLNRSAVLPGTSVAVSPLPDSHDASPRTQISLLGAPARALSGVTVSGSSSGSHRGRLLAYAQGDGASFVSARPFAAGETVTVHGRVRGSSGRTARFAYQFIVAHQDGLTYTPLAKPAKDYNEEQHFASAPTLQPPVLSVTANAGPTAPGDIFAAPYNGPGPSGPEIFSDSGELIWFHPLPGGTAATNLQVQQYDGRPVLTWWQGNIPPQGFGQGEEMIYSSSYRQIGRVHAGNGYEADLHDFHITPQRTALLTVFDPIYCDLSAVGGPGGGAVTDSVFQEVDLATAPVRREWHSLDPVALRETYSATQRAPPAWPFDFFHINSLDRLAGGETLISARNTWGLYELDTTTGQIGLRVGGRRSEVKALNGAATAYQHDAMGQPNGTITVFDNGAVPKVHPQSRALVVSIDPHARTDTLLAGYEHSRGLSAGSQGSVQTLAGGNLFVGWGSQPYFSEFSSAGQLLYDAHWQGSYQSYRAYRFPWAGTPSEPPLLALAPPASPGAPATAYASWNGATAIVSWRVLAGPSPTQLTPVAQAPKSGFQTAIATPGPAAYVAAQALDGAGAVLGTSQTVKG